jgi:hypothetical protein
MPESSFPDSNVVRSDQAPKSGDGQQTASPAETIVSPKKNWLQRWWDMDSAEKRSSPRETLPSIVAFYFSGGAPVPHGLRNISLDGAFVYTDERWFPGTIVRMTLADHREPSASRSITLNAMVVRSENDGVGFQFFFMKEKNQRRREPPAKDSPLVSVTKTQHREFLESVKTAA